MLFPRHAEHHAWFIDTVWLKLQHCSVVLARSVARGKGIWTCVFKLVSCMCHTASYATTVMSESGCASLSEGHISTTATGETIMYSGTDEQQCCSNKDKSAHSHTDTHTNTGINVGQTRSSLSLLFPHLFHSLAPSITLSWIFMTDRSVNTLAKQMKVAAHAIVTMLSSAHGGLVLKWAPASLMYYHWTWKVSTWECDIYVQSPHVAKLCLFYSWINLVAYYYSVIWLCNFFFSCYWIQCNLE